MLVVCGSAVPVVHCFVMLHAFIGTATVAGAVFLSQGHDVSAELLLQHGHSMDALHAAKVLQQFPSATPQSPSRVSTDDTIYLIDTFPFNGEAITGTRMPV